MKGILAVNNLGYIGLKYGLPWKCKADFQHFKKMTLLENRESTLLVGHNTAQTLPPLKGRKIIVVGKDAFLPTDIDWCIGGKKTYERYCPFFTELHISHINDNTIGDVMFPDMFRLGMLVDGGCKIFNYYFDVE